MFAFQGSLGRLLKKLALRRSNACTANSAFTRGQVLQLCPTANVTSCPWAWTLPNLNLDRTDLGLRQKLGVTSEMILFVGRLVEKEGSSQPIGCDAAGATEIS